MASDGAGVGHGRLTDAWTVLRRAVDEARDDRVTMTAQALAYALFLAIPSAVLVALGIFSVVADAGDIARLIDRLEGVLPAEATSLLADSLQRSSQSAGGGVIMTVVGLVLAVWSTTSAATTLMQGVTTAFDHDDERGFVRKRIVALLLVVCLTGAAALVVGLLVLGPHVERLVGDATGAPGLTSWLWWTAQWPVLLAGLLLAFAVLLYLAPDAPQRSWKLVTPGAVVAVVVWLVASGGFAIYTANFGSYNKSWGTLSAVVVTLVWLWLTSAALLFGAEVNAEAQRLADERDVRDGPVAAPGGQKPRVATGARHP